MTEIESDQTKLTVEPDTRAIEITRGDANAKPHMQEGARETWKRLAALVEESETGREA